MEGKRDECEHCFHNLTPRVDERNHCLLICPKGCPSHLKIILSEPDPQSLLFYERKSPAIIRRKAMAAKWAERDGKQARTLLMLNIVVSRFLQALNISVEDVETDAWKKDWQELRKSLAWCVGVPGVDI